GAVEEGLLGRHMKPIAAAVPARFERYFACSPTLASCAVAVSTSMRDGWSPLRPMAGLRRAYPTLQELSIVIQLRHSRVAGPTRFDATSAGGLKLSPEPPLYSAWVST